MPEQKTTAFFREFFTARPIKSAVAVFLLGLSGILEGVGVMTLIPMLSLAEGELNPNPQGVERYMILGLDSLGLEPTLLTLLGILFVLIVAKSALFWTAMIQVRMTMIEVVRDLRLRLFRSLLRAKWLHFVDQRAGAWANAASAESVASGAAFREGCEILAAVFPIAAYVGFATLLSWETSLFALASGAFLTLTLKGFVTVSRRAAQDQTVAMKELSGSTVDIVHGLKAIKAMGREGLIEPILHDGVARLDEAQRDGVYAQENLRFFQEPMLTLLLGSAIFFLFRVSGLSLPSVIVLAFMFYRILAHIKTLQMRYQILVGGEAAYWSLMSRIVGAEEQQEAGRTLGLDPGRLSLGLVLEDVSFAYGDEPVLKALNLKIPAGSFVAIHGESGSGKTTMIDLIVGLLTPSEGEIRIDGEPMGALDLGAWRSQIGYVPQEMLLLNDSIRNNVTLGDPSLSDHDVERALRLAGAWEFVSEKSAGVGSPVGERGGRLSGGQRQRIAIARALVTKPSLLILDEVTTALDPDTERGICKTLRGLAGEVTILSISHQPAMRDVADNAFSFEGGDLVHA